MACEITVDNISAVPSNDPTLLVSVNVVGGSTDCPSGRVRVTINCLLGSMQRDVDVDENDGSWTVTFVSATNALPCTCGELVTVEAVCVDSPGCQATPLQTNLICVPLGGCPSIIDILIEDDPNNPGCNADGTRNVKLSAVTSGTSIKSFLWKFGDSTSTFIFADVNPTGEVIHSYPAPGTSPSIYPVTLVLTGTDAICIDTRNTVVKVDPCGGVCPEITGLDAAEGECNSNGTKRTILLTASVAGGGITEFDWDFGDGESDLIDASVTSDPSTSHNYDAPGTFTATLTIRGPEGCKSSLTVDVSVSECPQCPKITNINPRIGECDGSKREITFGATVNGAGITTYDWEFGDGDTDSTMLPNVSHEFNAPGTYDVKLIIHGPGECVDEDEIKISVAECPQCPQIIEIDTDLGDCSNGKRSAGFTADVNGAPTSFAWRVNGEQKSALGSTLPPEDYPIGTDLTVEVIISGPGTCTSIEETQLTVPDCKSSCCPKWAIPLAIALATSFYVLVLAMKFCFNAPVGWKLSFLPAFGVAVVIAICFIICKLSGCRCPKFDKCFWLLTLWFSGAVGFLSALYIGPAPWCILVIPNTTILCPIGCCTGNPIWWIFIAAFFILFIYAFWRWVGECNVSKCQIYLMLTFVLVTVIGNLFTYALIYSPIEACRWTIVQVVAAALAAYFLIKAIGKCN